MITLIDETTQKNIDSWLKGDFDEASKKEIRRLQSEDPQKLIDAFYTHLSFGTGGLRGIMGVGTNRINGYTVRAATQGLANYIAKQAPRGEKQCVLIGYDCRNHSREFAEEAAKVLAANSIEVYLYNELRPVPLVSFGVLYKQCIAGIMITASHNPPQYNGYKVYWNHGGQVLPPHDIGIINEVNQIKTNSMVKIGSYPNSLIHEINGEVDTAYIHAIRDLQLHPGNNHSKGKDLHVVYTSLHGAGITMVPKTLEDWGFTNLTIVDAQRKPDGDFPTIKSPNPEEHATLKLGIETLEKVQGDILIGTDPDTDRIGVVVLHHKKPFFFNGNEIACLALEHVLRSLKESHSMPPKPMCVKTIVTTELFKAIADHYQVTCLDVLTGFKYIGEKIAQWDEEKKANITTHHYIFGGEESYGYLLGTHVRDKDAVISAALICDMALQLKLQGKTLVDFLYEIYQKYGIWREKLTSLTYEGKQGVDKMNAIMKHLRENPPKKIGEVDVTIVEDYLSHTSLHIETGKKEPLLLPKSDVVRFWLSDQTKIVIRPSGTEPKIKLYIGAVEKHHLTDLHATEKAIQACDRRVDTILGAVKKICLG